MDPAGHLRGLGGQWVERTAARLNCPCIVARRLVSQLQPEAAEHRQRPFGTQASHFRPPVVFGHFLLAAAGLVVWIVYVVSDSQALAWVAFVDLLVMPWSVRRSSTNGSRIDQQRAPS
jgi:hypothetical protein